MTYTLILMSFQTFSSINYRIMLAISSFLRTKGRHKYGKPIVAKFNYDTLLFTNVTIMSI